MSLLEWMLDPSVRAASRRVKSLERAIRDCNRSELSHDELVSLEASLSELQSSIGTTLGRDSAALQARLDRIWHPLIIAKPESTSRTLGMMSTRSYDDVDRGIEKSWSISLSHDFIKATSAIDRKLQGRVLEALMSITRAPVTVHGDTLKPLSGSKSGLWRMRLGDYRLIYKPEPKEKRVYCLSFSPREGAYA